MTDISTEQHERYDTDNIRNRTETICDDKGRVILRPNDTGDVSGYTYDPQSGKLLFVMSNDLKTEFNYDGQGNLIHAENSKGQVIDLDYAKTTLIQRMVEVNRAENTRRELTFKYNDAGRPTEIILVGIGKIAVEYDDAGEISKVDADGGTKVAIQVTLAFQNLMGLVKVAGTRL
jgi:YD repeat-containing protein